MTNVTIDSKWTEVVIEGSTLRITLRRGLDRFQTAVNLLLCGPFIYGGARGVRDQWEKLGQGHVDPMVLVTIAWCAGFFLMGMYLFTWTTWSLAGRETITVNDETLSIRMAVGPFGHTWVYELTGIQRLRLRQAVTAKEKKRALVTGRIEFDYGPRTFKFAVGAQEAQARYVLEQLAKRAPRLADPEASGYP